MYSSGQLAKPLYVTGLAHPRLSRSPQGHIPLYPEGEGTGICIKYAVVLWHERTSTALKLGPPKRAKESRSQCVGQRAQQT